MFRELKYITKDYALRFVNLRVFLNDEFAILCPCL